MPSLAFDAFVQPARRAPALWRTVLGAILVALIYAGSFAAALGSVAVILGPFRARDLAERLVALDTPRATLFLLATFLGMAVAPMAAVRLLHRRSAASLFGRAPRVLHDFAMAVTVVGALYALSIGLWSLAYDPVPNLPLGTWLALLPLTLLGLLLQTGAEELVFRGYLQQQLAARFASPLVWMLLPSLAFGFVHYAPAMTGENAWLMVGGAVLFGLFAADLTAATGSIGAAWGFHFVNNVVALAVLATDGTITGLALYLTPYAADGEEIARFAIVADVAMLTVAWALCRAVVRR